MDDMINKIEALYNKLFAGDQDAVDEYDDYETDLNTIYLTTEDYYDFVILDEAHHERRTVQPLFQELTPTIDKFPCKTY